MNVKESLPCNEFWERNCTLTHFRFLATGSESDVRDHRGMLGPRRRGAIVRRLRGGAHRPDCQDDQQHYLRRPHLHCDVSHQRGPTSQRVQHLNGWHHPSPELPIFFFWFLSKSELSGSPWIFKSIKHTTSNVNAAAALSRYWYLIFLLMFSVLLTNASICCSFELVISWAMGTSHNTHFMKS